MILPQFGHAHNLFYFNFLPVLKIDCFLYMSKGVSYVDATGGREPCIVFCTTSRLLSFPSNSSSCKHIFNGLRQNSRNIFLKIIPSQAGSDQRKFVDTFGRPSYTDWKKHVWTVSNPFNVEGNCTHP